MGAKERDLAARLLQRVHREDLADDPDKYPRKAQAILDQLLPMQRALAEDWHKRLALLTPGKNGKTFTVRARLLRKALTVKNAYCLYISLSRAKAKEDIWDGPSGLRNLVDLLGLKVGRPGDSDVDVIFHVQDLIVTFPKLGSQIRVAGADNMDVIEKFRGGPGYDEVWIDEAKSFPAALLRELIDQCLMPRILSPKDGVLGICGTPGNILEGYFYDLTRLGTELSVPYGEDNPDDLRWSCHRWSLAQNTIRYPGSKQSNWERALAYKKAQGWTDNNTTWRREYLGQWAAELTDFVYKFQQHTTDGEPWNIWTPKEKTKDNPFGLPSQVKVGGQWQPIAWRFGIGMDMGEDDPFALEVLAFSSQLPGHTYHVHEVIKRFRSEERPGERVFSRVDFIGESLRHAISLIQAYDDYPVCLVSDMAHMGEGVLAEVLIKYGIKIKKAEKPEKIGLITIVNDDLIDGRMHVLKDSTLAQQMSQLQYDETGKREHNKQHNDACDAVLYCRGELAKFLTHTQPATSVTPTADQLEQERIRVLLEQYNKTGQEYEITQYDSFSEYDP